MKHFRGTRYARIATTARPIADAKSAAVLKAAADTHAKADALLRELRAKYGA